MLTIITAILVTALDQFVKWYASGHMALGESIPIIPGVFHLTYILNPGAAFGILEGECWFFLAIVLALFAAYAWAYKKIPQEPAYFPLAVGMLLGGALGNAIDRVRLSRVVDFFDFRVWPIFNVADIAICCAVALLVFYFWRHGEE